METLKTVQLKQVANEPVAWYRETANGFAVFPGSDKPPEDDPPWPWFPLYTNPPSLPAPTKDCLKYVASAQEIADKAIADYEEHYDFPWQGKSHMHDCIVGAIEDEISTLAGCKPENDAP